LLLGAASTFFLIWGCNGFSTAENPEPVKEVFSTLYPLQQDVDLEVDYTAGIKAIRNVEIRARVEGYLDQILVDEGQRVSKGQILFKINDEEYKAALNKARAQIKVAEAEAASAQIELDRVRLLVEKNVVTRTELDLAQAKLEIARARIEEARSEEARALLKLSNTEIRSPFDGVVNLIPFKIGSLIREGDLLTTLSDVSRVYAYYNVSEVEYLEGLAGDKDDSLRRSRVELVLADGSVFPVPGRIETIAGEFDKETGSIALRAVFDNKDYVLKHGSTGKIRLHRYIRNALLVPQKSTIEIQDKLFVFIVENNMVRLKSFKPLQRYGKYYIVSEGLSRQDLFVYEGVQDLQEGQVIETRLLSPEEILKDLPLL
jgi:membrane fusion protein (multidrug efflux system)